MPIVQLLPHHVMAFFIAFAVTVPLFIASAISFAKGLPDFRRLLTYMGTFLMCIGTLSFFAQLFLPPSSFLLNAPLEMTGDLVLGSFLFALSRLPIFGFKKKLRDS